MPAPQGKSVQFARCPPLPQAVMFSSFLKESKAGTLSALNKKPFKKCLCPVSRHIAVCSKENFPPNGWWLPLGLAVGTTPWGSLLEVPSLRGKLKQTITQTRGWPWKSSQGFNFRSWITFFFPLVFSTVHIEEVLFDNVKIYNDQTRIVSLPVPYLAISPLCRAASNSSSSWNSNNRTLLWTGATPLCLGEYH